MEEARQEVAPHGGTCTRLLAAAFALLAALFLAPGQGRCAEPAERALATQGLIEPASLDPGIVLDIRYATKNNFTGEQVYPSARCYLRADIAQRLLRVQQALRKLGMGLKVYDCYRPYSVQEAFWRIMPDERYVLEPRRENGVIVKSSRHNRGAAVDVTLVDGRGNELEMPTPFDDFTEKAHRGSAAATPQAARNSQTLERAMQAEGFEPLPTEWWHFDGPGWRQYPPLDLPLPAGD